MESLASAQDRPTGTKGKHGKDHGGPAHDGSRTSFRPAAVATPDRWQGGQGDRMGQHAHGRRESGPHTLTSLCQQQRRDAGQKCEASGITVGKAKGPRGGREKHHARGRSGAVGAAAQPRKEEHEHACVAEQREGHQPQVRRPMPCQLGNCQEDQREMKIPGPQCPACRETDVLAQLRARPLREHGKVTHKARVPHRRRAKGAADKSSQPRDEVKPAPGNRADGQGRHQLVHPSRPCGR